MMRFMTTLAVLTLHHLGGYHVTHELPAIADPVKQVEAVYFHGLRDLGYCEPVVLIQDVDTKTVEYGVFERTEAVAQLSRMSNAERQRAAWDLRARRLPPNAFTIVSLTMDGGVELVDHIVGERSIPRPRR